MSDSNDLIDLGTAKKLLDQKSEDVFKLSTKAPNFQHEFWDAVRKASELVQLIDDIFRKLSKYEELYLKELNEFKKLESLVKKLERKSKNNSI